MVGAAIIVIVMLLLGPVALFVGGALWSAFVGTQLSERVAETPQRD
jgi:hypothetical protein